LHAIVITNEWIYRWCVWPMKMRSTPGTCCAIAQPGFSMGVTVVRGFFSPRAHILFDPHCAGDLARTLARWPF